MSDADLKTVLYALISSCLGYCNALYSGVSQTLIKIGPKCGYETPYWYKENGAFYTGFGSRLNVGFSIRCCYMFIKLTMECPQVIL